MTQGSFTPRQPPPPPMAAPPAPKGFAVAALSTGIIAFVLGFVPLLSLGIGGAAIVLGIIALRKSQSRGMSWTGIITGALGALASIFMAIAGILIFDQFVPESTSAPLATTSPAITPSASPSPTVSETSAAPEPTPEASTAPPVEDDPSGTASQLNALDEAHAYLHHATFSPVDLVAQLEFDGFSNADAEWAADNVTVDWAQQAVTIAERYLDTTAFSRSGLIEQLEYEGFSHSHAVAAADSVTVDWNEQAAAKTEEYLDFTSISRSSLIEQLVLDGFTEAQAQYGVDQAGL